MSKIMYEENESGYSFMQSIYHEVGNFNNLNIRVIESIDMIENYRDFAIRFELVHVNEKNEIDGRYYLNVLADESEQLVLAMETIINKIVVDPPKNYTEVVFSSSEGLQTGCFWYEEDKSWYEFINVGQDENSQLILKLTEYKKLLKLIQKAVKMINK
ncbi:MAG: hypothetical protein Kow0068_15010 [Marinilabiliales bacterium]